MEPARPASAVGWLAKALVSADFALRDAERQVEGFLSSLFEAWRGWSFVQHNSRIVEINVYQALDNPAAVSALHRAGFAIVKLHNHRAGRFLSCTCETHEVEGP